MEYNKLSGNSAKFDGTAIEPILVSIRPVMRCNFSCKFCLSNSDSSRKEEAKELELDKFFEQLDKANFNGTLHICGGEPFLYKNIDNLMVKCDQHAPEVAVLTNGSWIPFIYNDQTFLRLKERLERVKQLTNVMIRISIDSYHMDGEAGNPKSFERLKLFVKAADEIGLIPGKHYSVQVTERTDNEAIAMGNRIAMELGTTKGPLFIRTRSLYRLGRAKNETVGRRFSLGEGGYIAVGPTLSGNLIIYAGRLEETKDIVYGTIDKLSEVIENHRRIIASELRG